MKKKLLFITGSMNQTTQMHQIAKELNEYDCWFSQIFADSPFLNFIYKYTSIANTTIVAPHFREQAENYLRSNDCQIDYSAALNKYDLVVYCSDMLIPDRFLFAKTVWVQEGMTDPYNRWSDVVKKLHLPPYLTGNTSLNGSSNVCDIYCAASQGYKDYFTMRGTEGAKIFATGTPNFDNIRQYTYNEFPHKDYVMVATSDMRETYRIDNRKAFIKRCVDIANGRRLLFKLHPNEVIDRAVGEIKALTPKDTLIYWGGNTNEMIANSVELITQYSTVAYVGLALNIPVHSYFDVEELKRLTPIQNNGTSAKNIAHICRNFVEFEGKKEDFAKQFHYEPYQDEFDKMLDQLTVKKKKKGKNTEGVEEVELV
jgi:hypothetical protein